MVRIQENDTWGEQELHNAAKKGEVETVERLINSRINLRHYPDNTLH